MKKINIYSILLLMAAALFLNACGGSKNDELSMADSTGLPGDNFSLAGALDLFKNSSDLADFEKKLNIEKNKVNNLDLNGDEKIDYITVIDLNEKSSHAILLQVPIDSNEFQDIAVISIVLNGKEKATLQIIGNELLYGDSAIFEPVENNKTEQAGFGVPLYLEVDLDEGVNVWLWPPVLSVYSPEYKVYESPVVYNQYPKWYKPWKPYPYGWYRREVAHHNKGYHPVMEYRPNPATLLYLPVISNSPFVFNRYQNLYKQNGWPKAKGHFGPASKFKGQSHGIKGNMKFKDHNPSGDGQKNKSNPGNDGTKLKGNNGSDKMNHKTQSKGNTGQGGSSGGKGSSGKGK